MIASEYNLSGHVAYSYARFSDPSQGAGHSLERQQEYAPEFCDEYGCKLNTTLSFSDSGKSAFHGKHIAEGGGLSRFKACIDAGLVQAGDILIVENLDRVSRLPLEQAEDLLKSILIEGVRIHTRSPWAIYDRATLNDPMQRMQMIFEFTRSHRESLYKQERLTRRWIRNREHLRQGDYKLSRLPGWLEPDRDGTGKVVGYRVIPEHAATIRRIFKLCVDGYGLNAVCKMLNQDGTPTMGKAKNWGRSSIAKILNNRAVLGEYQPHSTVKLDGKAIVNTKRVATGEPIPNHYPRIVDDNLFDAAAQAATSRATHRTGAGTARVTNLFAGIIRDARDGSSMHVVDKGYGHQLVSLAGANGISEAVYVPYSMIEQAFVVFAHDMPLEMIMPREVKKIDEGCHALRKEIDSLKKQVAKIKDKLRTNTSDALLELLVERDVELKAKGQELETLERQRGSAATVAASTTKEILDTLAKAKGAKLLELRTKLRNELRYWLKTVTVLPLNLAGVKAAMVDVELQNGSHFQFRASNELVNYPPELDGADILRFNKWPKSIRKTEWDTEQPNEKRIKELDDAGLPLESIAKELGITKSVASRQLIKLGRRRRQRKSADSKQLMTWHAQGNGWVKRKAGKRYFVGMGTLKSLYPKLVKSEDKEGSMEAANKWWNDNAPKR